MQEVLSNETWHMPACLSSERAKVAAFFFCQAAVDRNLRLHFTAGESFVGYSNCIQAGGTPGLRLSAYFISFQ